MTSAVKNVKIFVEAWINAWHSHDLEKILSHHSINKAIKFGYLESGG